MPVSQSWTSAVLSALPRPAARGPSPPAPSCSRSGWRAPSAPRRSAPPAGGRARPARHAAEEADVVAHAHRLHPPPQRSVLVDLVADDQELEVLVPGPLLEGAEGADQAVEVLVGLDVPRVEDEPPPDLVALLDALHLL